jgi:transglutaminase-like putative cysteine protease
MRLLLSLYLLLFATPPEPRTPSFHFEYNFVYEAYEDGLPPQAVVWIPLPHSDNYQTIRNLKIDSYPYEIKTSPDGNVMAFVSIPADIANVAGVKVSFDAVRKEHLQPRLANGPRLEHEEDPKVLARYLNPDRLVPIDGKIRQWAEAVVNQAHAKTDLEMARAIYNHVVATVKYDKTGKGWGRGDIYYACEERRGNCTDFHAIFIGYARALGIPARFAIGFPLPSDRGEGQIAGYHCWAEFYTRGIGWVPVDARKTRPNASTSSDPTTKTASSSRKIGT